MALVIEPISPVAFNLFGLDVRWYALAYVSGFVLGYYLFKRLMCDPNSMVKLTKKQLDDLLTWVVFGVILGGRLGYVLFYDLGYFLLHPMEIFAVWHGGMSFHGGLIGVIVSTFLFARTNRLNPWSVLDIMSVCAPIGLFFGRVANFINREVMGRPSEVPWAVVFNGDTPHFVGGIHGNIIQRLAFNVGIFTDKFGIGGTMMAFRLILIQRLGHRTPGSGPEIAAFFIAQVHIAARFIKLIEHITQNTAGSTGLDEAVTTGIDGNDGAVGRGTQIVRPRSRRIGIGDDIFPFGVIEISVLHRQNLLKYLEKMRK